MLPFERINLVREAPSWHIRDNGRMRVVGPRDINRTKAVDTSGALVAEVTKFTTGLGRISFHQPRRGPVPGATSDRTGVPTRWRDQREGGGI